MMIFEESVVEMVITDRNKCKYDFSTYSRDSSSILRSEGGRPPYIPPEITTH